MYSLKKKFFYKWLKELDHSELKIIIFIYINRKNKISINEFDKGTGLARSTVINSTKSLISKGIITKATGFKNKRQFSCYSIVVEEL
jgi:DNA-binding MarR family transcriptional regulator